MPNQPRFEADPDYRRARRELAFSVLALVVSQLALFFAVWVLVEQTCR